MKTFKNLLQSIMLLAAISLSTAGICADSTNMPITDLQATLGDSGFPVITGTATNQTGKRAGNVFIQINLYNAQGAVIGNTAAHATNLEPGEKWQIRAQTGVKSFNHFKVTEVTVLP